MSDGTLKNDVDEFYSVECVWWVIRIGVDPGDGFVVGLVGCEIDQPQ